METERFPLHTSRIIPKWFLFLWDAAVLLIVGAISLAAWPHPAAVVIVVMGVLAIGFMHILFRGYAIPDKNFVELERDHFRVSVYAPRNPLSQEISYALVERVDENAQYSLWWPFGFWPYSPRGNPNHVLIRLRHVKVLSLAWGRLSPWVRVIHLDIMDRQRFADALRERVARSTLH